MELHGKIVLVVDDEPDNVLVLQCALEVLYGTTVYVARDGLDAMELLKSLRPDLVLADLSMPNMDGFQLRQALETRQDLKDTQIVAVTAHAMLSDRDRVQAAGFDGYLSKPIRVEHLEGDIAAGLFEPEVMDEPACFGR